MSERASIHVFWGGVGEKRASDGKAGNCMYQEYHIYLIKRKPRAFIKFLVFSMQHLVEGSIYFKIVFLLSLTPIQKREFDGRAAKYGHFITLLYRKINFQGWSRLPGYTILVFFSL